MCKCQHLYIKSCVYRLYLGKVEDVGQKKMFLEDSFSVARILILSFFVLLVVLASILDISGVVENMSYDPANNEMSGTPKEVAEESCQDTGVRESETSQHKMEVHQQIESSSDSLIEISRSSDDKEILCDETNGQGRVELKQDAHLSEDTSNTDAKAFQSEPTMSLIDDNDPNNISKLNEADDDQEESNKMSTPALSPIEDKENNISRPVHQATTVRGEERGMLKAMAEAGYRDMAVNILGQMGLDHVDGAESSEDGERVRSEDDIGRAGSSRWPGPDHRPDLTSLRASGDTGDKCHTGGTGEARTGQAIGTRDIGIVIPEKNKAGGKKDSLTLLLHAFSAKRNLPKIFNINDSSEGELSCLHGIRFLSMTWVILGHTFFFSLPYVDNPVWALNVIQNSWTMEAVEQGLFSVDSFFFLSGLLVSYIFLKRRSSMDQLTSPLTWIKVILHRYVRLLPPYIALVLLLEPLSFYTCSGPQVFECSVSI